MTHGTSREEFCLLDEFKGWPHFKITRGHRAFNHRSWSKKTGSASRVVATSLSGCNSVRLSFGASLTFPQVRQEEGISQAASRPSCYRRALVLKASLMGSQGLAFRSLPVSGSFDHTQDEILLQQWLHSISDDVPSFLTKKSLCFISK